MTEKKLEGPIVWGFSIDDSGFRVITIDDCPVGANGIHEIVGLLTEGGVFQGSCRYCDRELELCPGNISEELARRAPVVSEGGS